MAKEVKKTREWLGNAYLVWVFRKGSELPVFPVNTQHVCLKGRIAVRNFQEMLNRVFPLSLSL
jgi:hypothetical protein